MHNDRGDDLLEYEIRPGDVVILSRLAIVKSTSEVAAFIRGDGTTIAPFIEPDYDWETASWVEGPSDRTGAESRLYALASLLHPFPWVDDPRMAEWQRLLDDLSAGNDITWPEETRDLWQLVLALVRAERFNSGTLASHAIALSHIANEIRQRLLDGPARNG
jgi:hypothetical protein